MYGTVAVCHVRSDNFAKLQAMATAEDYRNVDGYLGTDLLVVDNHPDTVLLVVRFRDQDTYRANGDSADQDSRYQELARPDGGRPGLVRRRLGPRPLTPPRKEARNETCTCRRVDARRALGYCSARERGR